MVLDPEIEKGLLAECWFCDKVFQKGEYCPTCGFYKCERCKRCACSLEGLLWRGKDVRRMLEKTVYAMSKRKPE